MKKLFLLLAAICLAVVSQAETKRLYLRVDKGWWTADNAAVGAYAWKGENKNSSWPGAKMNRLHGDDYVWYIDLDAEAYDNIIFTRINPNDGTYWTARTQDLTIPKDANNFYEITSNDGTWDSGQNPQRVAGAWHQYYRYVTGSSNLVGEDKNWNPAAILMDNNIHTFHNMPAGTYDMKVTNGTWDSQWGYSNVNFTKSSLGLSSPEDNNIQFTLKETSDITVKMENGRLCVTFSNPAPEYTGGGIGYLLPAGCNYDKQTGALTGFDDEFMDSRAQEPEGNAARWFRDNYVNVTNPTGKFITTTEFQNEANRADIDVLWIHIDRVEYDNRPIHEYQNEQGLTEDFRAALKIFVTNEGKNLLLSKQACHLLGNLQRSRAQNGTDIVWPEYNKGGYDKNREQWFIATHFANRANKGHKIYSKHNGDPLSDNAPANFEITWMRDGSEDHHATDHNCGLTPGNLGMNSNNDYTNMQNWEEKNAARILGTWGGCTDMPYAGIVEFYPKKWDDTNNFQGTIMMFGLAAYTWASNNTGWGHDHVRMMTESALSYLSKPVLEWETVPGDGIIFEEKGAKLKDIAGRTWTLSTDNTKAYTIDNNRVRYMAIADELPVTATVNAGDGFSASKNVYSLTQNVKVGRDNAPAAPLAYVLMNTNLNNLDSDDAGSYDPMYQSAEWFYNTYVSKATGRFVTYEDIRDHGVPASVKTLWLHIDRKFTDASDFTSNYAKAELYDKLAAYVKAGGNLYLSGFATYLVHSMNRYETAPDNCGWASVYESNVDWHINMHCDGHMINGGATKLFMAKGSNCTNRNCLWDEPKDAVNTDTHCKVLAGWGHADGFLSAGMVEFYPKEAWKGTIIVNGLAACQWGTCNSDEIARKNLKDLTSRTLEYLGKDLSFAWITEPKDGMVSDQKEVKISHVIGNAPEFQVLEPNTEKASFGEVTKTDDGDYATLTYNAVGEGITIKVMGRGDGLNIPKSKEFSLEKTITILSQVYTRDVTSTYSTICLPREATVVSGVEKVFSLAGLQKTGETLTGIVLDEVEGPLAAGTPYVIRTEGTKEVPVTISFNQEGAESEVQSANGLMGTLTDITINASTNGHSGSIYYLATDGLLHRVSGSATVKIGANKAYFDLTGVQEVTNHTPAPGRMFMAIDGAQPLPTALDGTIEGENGTKMIRNGQLIIRRGESYYDVMGNRIN